MDFLSIFLNLSSYIYIMYYLSCRTTGSVGTVNVLIKSRATTKIQDTKKIDVHAAYTNIVKVYHYDLKMFIVMFKET